MRVLLATIFAMQTASAFVVRPLCFGRAVTSSVLASGPHFRRGRVTFGRPMTTMVAAADTDTATSSSGLLPGERYVICNRFNNRMPKAAAFEQRWAERKSSLAKLDGFRFFTLLRRVDKVGERTIEYPADTPDYMSMTVWENKDNFVAWRKGPAFREAHGGGTIGGVLSAIYGVITELKRMPKTGAWEGLMPLTLPKEATSLVLKGRREDTGMADADGESVLPAECFVAMNRMTCAPGKGPDLEKYWRERETTLSTSPGFVGFTLMRKDAGGKEKGKPLPDDVFNYSTCTVWANQESYDAWRRLHFAQQEAKQAAGTAREGFARYLEGPPSAIFWEGTQVIQSPLGF